MTGCITVFGGTGFIGRHLVALLFQSWCDGALQPLAAVDYRGGYCLCTQRAICLVEGAHRSDYGSTTTGNPGMLAKMVAWRPDQLSAIIALG
jgi:hypothetical protein